MSSSLAAAAAETQQPSLIPLSYCLVVVGVSNIREEQAEEGQRVRVCWVRKQRVIQSTALAVGSDGAISFGEDGYQMKMIARMGYDHQSRVLESKVTQL